LTDDWFDCDHRPFARFQTTLQRGDMKLFKTTVWPVLVAGIWINISEFARNELIVKADWVAHYRQLNLIFPSGPLNGLVWGIWGFSLAAVIRMLARKYTLLQTALLSWFTAFFMMWLAIGNLGVLPAGILWLAVPLSLLETAVGSWIIFRFLKPDSSG